MKHCIKGHSAVREASVVRRLELKRLIKPKAYVVLREGNEPTDELKEDIKRGFIDRLGTYIYPRWVKFIHELPKTATGRIQLSKLR